MTQTILKFCIILKTINIFSNKSNMTRRCEELDFGKIDLFQKIILKLLSMKYDVGLDIILFFFTY